MIERVGDRLLVSGDVTISTVTALFKKDMQFKLNGAANTVVIVDFSQLGKVDSSAVSLMLAWLREAGRSSVTLKFDNVPKNLRSLANLYGVAELFNLDAA